MKTQAIRTLYPQLTPEQRVHLVLAATARGDNVEVARLDWSCPQAKVKEYRDLLDRMWHVGMRVLYHWLDVSHRVVRTSFAVAVLNDRVRVYEGLLGLAPHCGASDYAKKLKIIVREDRALLVGAEAKCKQLIAEWKGFEAAITQFRAERCLTTQQLFAMVPGLPSAIEEARAELDADVPADPQMQDALYRALCQVVPGPNAHGRG